VRAVNKLKLICVFGSALECGHSAAAFVACENNNDSAKMAFSTFDDLGHFAAFGLVRAS